MMQINGDFKVSQVLNNNVVSAVDSKGRELILTGKGLGFKAGLGKPLDVSVVDKIFLLEENDLTSSRLKVLIESLPLEIVEITDYIIEHVKSELNLDISDSLFVSLADHLDFAWKRAKDGVTITNPLEWEIKTYYEAEYHFSTKMIQQILIEYGVLFDEVEACSIALHIINANTSGSIGDFKTITQVVTQILNIIKYIFKIKINEKTNNYHRFITHLKFFAQRITKHEVINNHDDLYIDILLQKQSKTHDCVETIADFVNKNYSHTMSKSEKFYLIIHIDNVVRDNL